MQITRASFAEVLNWPVSIEEIVLWESLLDLLNHPEKACIQFKQLLDDFVKQVLFPY